MDLSQAADKLYALPREEFMAARTELVKRAKSDGDKELAAAVGKLRRPTVAAWLVNRLARDRPAGLHELTALGAELRAAHEQLDGAALRRLSGSRRELLAGLDAAAREVGAAAGVTVSDATARELEEMFTAGLAGEAAGAALAAGRLSSAKALTEGEGDWPSVAADARPRPTLVKTPPESTEPAEPEEPSEPEESPAEAPGKRPHARSSEPSDARAPAVDGSPDAGPPAAGGSPDVARAKGPSAAVRRARAELDRLEAAVADAQRRFEQAGRDYDAAAEEETDAHQAVAHRRAELVAAEQAEQRARQRARFARRAREDADREHAQARRRAQVARDRLHALTPDPR